MTESSVINHSINDCNIVLFLQIPLTTNTILVLDLGKLRGPGQHNLNFQSLENEKYAYI